jgi:PAS domain S-box-containing protein
MSVTASNIKEGHFSSSHPVMSIAETLTNGFFTVDRQWTVLQWNKAAENLSGVRASDIIGKNLWEKFAGIIPVKFYTVYHKAFDRDTPVHFEEYWDEMGSWFDVIAYHSEDTLSVSFKKSHQSAGPVQAEQQLEVLNHLYRYVTEVTSDCLWDWDLQAREIFWIDGGHKRVFGYPIVNATIPQVFWENRIHPDDKARMLEKLRKTSNSKAGIRWEAEYRFKKYDGEYAYVHERAHIIRDAEGGPTRMIGATQDVTLRTSLFPSALAHEIRNPLTNINLAVELMQIVAKDEELKKYLEIISRGSTKINNLLNALLKYEHRGAEPVEQHFIHYLLDEVLKTAEDRIMLKHISVRRQYDSPGCKIFVNTLDIKMALTNIIINAIDAMPAENGELEVLIHTDEKKCLLEIKDNGTGISELDLKKIFTPYFTGKTGGLGLGLASSLEILLANDVAVDVRSELGKGTRFLLSFNIV